MNDDQQELDLGLTEDENNFVTNLKYIKEKLSSINLNYFYMRTSVSRLTNGRII